MGLLYLYIEIVKFTCVLYLGGQSHVKMHDYACLPVLTFISIITNHRNKEIIELEPTVSYRKVKLLLSMPEGTHWE
jgi:hypothetical protein